MSTHHFGAARQDKDQDRGSLLLMPVEDMVLVMLEMEV
jgi:hypothetical protein